MDNIVNFAELRKTLHSILVTEDLRTACFDLGCQYENIVPPSDTLTVAIQHVILYFEKRARLHELIEHFRSDFPNANWESVFSVSSTDSKIDLAGESVEVVADMPRQEGPLRVFLCHAREDKNAAYQLYKQLKWMGFEPWLDAVNLLPGQRWRDEIPRAISESNVMLVCISDKSIRKDGYVKEEIQLALDLSEKRLPRRLGLIPVRLEVCDVPERLGDWQWVDLFNESGYERLFNAISSHDSKPRSRPSNIHSALIRISTHRRFRLIILASLTLLCFVVSNYMPSWLAVVVWVMGLMGYIFMIRSLRSNEDVSL
jgi:TIR domain